MDPSSMEMPDYVAELARRCVAMKEGLVGRTMEGQNDDLAPIVHAHRNDQTLAIIGCQVVSRDMGLYACAAAAQGLGADELWLVTDAHMSHSGVDAQGEPWAPGGMQQACDNDGACALGLITDCINVAGVERSGRHWMLVLPYHVHKTERTVRWVDDDTLFMDDAVDPEAHVGGYLFDCMDQCFATPVKEGMAAKTLEVLTLGGYKVLVPPNSPAGFEATAAGLFGR
jgi:hypothetical protein